MSVMDAEVRTRLQPRARRTALTIERDGALLARVTARAGSC
jgi:hypothetical protein